jgi:hypothetical protein
MGKNGTLIETMGWNGTWGNNKNKGFYSLLVEHNNSNK